MSADVDEDSESEFDEVWVDEDDSCPDPEIPVQKSLCERKLSGRELQSLLDISIFILIVISVFLLPLSCWPFFDV